MQFPGINKRVRAGLHQVWPSFDSFWDATTFFRLPLGRETVIINVHRTESVTTKDNLFCVSEFSVEKFFSRN